MYSKAEELANSITHGLGVLFAVGALITLWVLTAYNGTTTHFVSYTVYGVSMILLYTASTLYHALKSEEAKRFFKVCDHSAIYLLIAGTYTPFLVINMTVPWMGWALGFVWACAVVGVVFKFYFTGRFRLLSTLLYLGMGWMVVFLAGPLGSRLPADSIRWIVIGGVTYTVGAGVYMMKKVPFTHAIWHLFVLFGSVSHFVAMLYATKFA